MKWRTGSFTSQVTHEMSNFPPVSLANFLWKSATQVRHPSIPSIPSNGLFYTVPARKEGKAPINSINSIKRAFSIQFLPGRRAKPPSIPSIPSNEPFFYTVPARKEGKAPINSINSIKRAFSMQFLPGRRAKPPSLPINSIKRAFSIQFMPGRRAKPSSIPSIPSNEPFLYSSCQEGGQSPHQFHQFHQTSLFYAVPARKEGKAPINSINSALSGEGVPVPCPVSSTGLVSRPWSEFGTSKPCRFCNVRAGAQAISGAQKCLQKSLQMALRGPPASNFVGLRLADQHSQAFEACE